MKEKEISVSGQAEGEENRMRELERVRDAARD